jgi:hypothetical protein
MPNRKISLSKEHLEKILKPINKITESCVLKGRNDELYSICSTEDKSVILYAKLKISNSLEEDLRLNLMGVKKLISGLNSLGNVGLFSLLLYENYIKCEIDIKGKKSHLKYHLVDDDIIKEFPLKIEKIMSLSFDTEFELSAENAKRILAASSFATEAQKVYFSLNDGVINAEITDKSFQNIDSMLIPITDTWKGDELISDFPISLEIFKNLVSLKNNIKVKINNECKVAVFHIVEDGLLELKYIVSALIK